MSITKKLKFELNTIKDRLKEIQLEYNNEPCKYCGSILNVKVNTKSGYIRISFETFAYVIFIYKNAYMFTWFSKCEFLKNNEPYYVQNGCITCHDVSEVCRELYDRIFSGFSPFRGSRWYQYGIPKEKNKHMKHNGGV